MFRLSRLAALYNNAEIKGWTAFDDVSFIPEVHKIREAVKAERPFTCSPVDDGSDEERRPDFHQNRYHCVEAWRKAILLYTYQIFDRQSDDTTTSTISHLAHMVLDHVRWIAKSDEIQKQILLPIFLAGAEMKTDENRDFVRQYCNMWGRNAECQNFSSAVRLLKDIWRQTDAVPDGRSCWIHHIGPHDWSLVISSKEAITSSIVVRWPTFLQLH